MGGDAQPQILLQLAARLFHYGQSPAAAIARRTVGAAGPVHRVRHVDQRPGTHSDGRGPRARRLDERARPSAATRSTSRPAYDSGFGHAHAIVIDARRASAAGAADPRTMVGTAAGI